MKIIHLLSFLSFSFLTHCRKEFTPPNHQNIDEMNQLILEEMEKDHIPSLAACIVKDDRIVWRNYYGYHNIENNIPPTSETIYLLASISKTVTSVAIMQLYEQGMIDLEEDINHYLEFEIRNPNFPDIPITTRMLLTHTLGLAWPSKNGDPNFSNTYLEDSAPPLSSWIREYLRPDGNQYLPATWKNIALGDRYQYSNIGGALLGYLVESVSGQGFNEYCQKNIFQPLSMDNSGFRLTDIDTSKLAAIYQDGRILEQYSVSHYPASMLKSSIDEWSHFLIAIINGGKYNNERILKEKTVKEMLAIKIPQEDIAFIWSFLGKGWMGHIGGYWGVSSSFDLQAEYKVGEILLTNTYGKESLYPKGNIYKILHFEASKYFD